MGTNFMWDKVKRSKKKNEKNNNVNWEYGGKLLFGMMTNWRKSESYWYIDGMDKTLQYCLAQKRLRLHSGTREALE